MGITNDDNMYNNPNQSVEANAGAVTNPEGLMKVQPDVESESLSDIKTPVSEAEPPSVVEEKPKDESPIVENPVIESPSSEAEPKVDSPEAIESDSQIVEALLKKYPRSFTDGVTDAGESYLIFKGGKPDDSGSFTHKRGDFDSTLVVCQAGMIDIKFNLWKQIEHFGGLKTQFTLTTNEGFSRATVKLDNDQEQENPIIGFRDKGIELKRYKDWWSLYEKEHKNDEEPKPLTSQEIIDSL